MYMESSLFGGWYNTDEQQVGVEGMSQLEILLGVERCKISTRAVTKGVLDVKCNYTTGALKGLVGGGCFL